MRDSENAAILQAAARTVDAFEEKHDDQTYYSSIEKHKRRQAPPTLRPFGPFAFHRVTFLFRQPTSQGNQPPSQPRSDRRSQDDRTAERSAHLASPGSSRRIPSDRRAICRRTGPSVRRQEAPIRRH